MRLSLSEAFAALGVAKDASPELVRQSYRQLALRFHPDKNSDADATAMFQRVSAAYKRICDHRERQQKREASSDAWSAGSPFFGASDEEFEDVEFEFEDEDDDDDISLEEMFMFQMMFASGKAPGAHINIGGRRRRTKGKRQSKQSHGSRGFNAGMMDIEEEMARIFMADPFAFHADELDSDEEDDEFMDLARFLAMGGRPAMRDFFGVGGAKSDGRSGRSDNNADKGKSQQRGEHEEKKASAAAQEDAPTDSNQNNDSSQDRSALAVGASVQVYGRLPGVVKFVGHVHYAKGEFVGVELRDAAGKNSGTIKGVSYFSCAPGRGLMVRPTDVACAPSA